MNTLSVPLLYYLTVTRVLKKRYWITVSGSSRASRQCRLHLQRTWELAACEWHSILWELFNDNRFKAELDRQIDNTLCARIVESTTRR